VLDPVELVERDVEPVRHRVRGRRDERVAAPERMALDAGQRHRDALARLGALDGPVVDLDAADSHVAARGLGSQHVALDDRAGPERARRDRPDPAQREGAVDVEARREVGRALVDARRALRVARRGRRRSSR
jgi:hypothetical protein